MKSKYTEDDTAIIPLSGNQPIAQGKFCFCYIHPQDSALCIKIPSSHRKAHQRRNADRSYYRKLHRAKIDLTHIADHLGVCKTDKGEGDLYQHIFDRDGLTSKTITHYLNEQPDLAPQILAHLISLGRHLLKNAIMISDLHGNNVLLQQLDENLPKLTIVDGIGDRVFLTVLNIFPFFKRRKIIRRWNRFIDRLQRSHPSINIPSSQYHLVNHKP